MKYRGLFYFFFTAFIIYLLIFSDYISLANHNDKDRQQIIKELSNKMKQPTTQIVETFIEIDSKNQQYLSNLSSKNAGVKKNKEKYNYYEDIRFIVKEENIKKNVNALGYEKPFTAKEKNDKTAINLLPNQYVRQKVSINMDEKGVYGLDARKDEYVAYLIPLAKKIFYNWRDFTPMMQIRYHLVKADKKDTHTGTVALYFTKKNRLKIEQAVFMQPFASETINNLTLRSFKYLNYKTPPKGMKINFFIIRLTVNRSLQFYAEFKFDYHRKNSE